MGIATTATKGLVAFSVKPPDALQRWTHFAMIIADCDYSSHFASNNTKSLIYLAQKNGAVRMNFTLRRSWHAICNADGTRLFALRIQGGQIMIKTIFASIALLTVTAPATAGIVYMTGNDNPWGQSSEDDAMDKAFGAGNWTKINGFTTSALSGSSFVYIDGGADTSADFNSFVSSNLAALESYVTAGGSLVLNAARWDFNPNTLNTVFGSTITGDDSYSVGSGIADLTAAGAAAGLGANGAGSSWTGGYFSHDVVSGGTCLVSGSAGCVFTVGTAGAGSWGVGGQTAPYFQSTGGLELRANELKFVADGGMAGAVPEPASWAMMIAGFGLVGASARRRRNVLATA